MSNAFLDETRSERLDLGLPMMKQLRASPTLTAVLMDEKPATQTWGDFALAAMVEKSVHARMVRGDLRGVIRLLVRLIGQPSDERLTNGLVPDARQAALTNGNGSRR
jgi:hypothetical protein